MFVLETLGYIIMRWALLLVVHAADEVAFYIQSYPYIRSFSDMPSPRNSPFLANSRY